MGQKGVFPVGGSRQKEHRQQWSKNKKVHLEQWRETRSKDCRFSCGYQNEDPIIPHLDQLMNAIPGET